MGDKSKTKGDKARKHKQGNKGGAKWETSCDKV